MIYSLCKKYWGYCGSPSSAAPGAASHLSLYSILAIALSSEVMIYSLCTTFASGRIEMTRARANRDVFYASFHAHAAQRRRRGCDGHRLLSRNSNRVVGG